MAGRPRDFDRDVALKRARDVFWRRGYEGTSMPDLIAAMGIASARIYNAFGSKEALFREAIALYEAGEGSFIALGLSGRTALQTFNGILRNAAFLYTRPGEPLGCMVVTAAANCSGENEALFTWLTELRRQRTRAFVTRIRRGIAEGELRADTNAVVLGDYLAMILHGMSVQASDGVPRNRLLSTVQTVITPLIQASYY